MPSLQATLISEPDPRKSIQKTIQLMGNVIKQARTHVPLVTWFGRIAATAPRKDYLTQVRKIYDSVMGVWNYTKEPEERVIASPNALWKLTLGEGGKFPGFGDCDDVVLALASGCYLVGLPVRFATIKHVRDMNPLPLPGHVYLETLIPGIGWFPLDPVMEPASPGFGNEPPYKYKWIYDLNGNMINEKKNTLKGDMKEYQTMYPYDAYNHYQGYSGMGSFWEDLADFFDDFTYYIGKYGMKVAPVLNCIPMVGPALSAAVMVAASARKMYDDIKAKDVKSAKEGGEKAIETIESFQGFGASKGDLSAAAQQKLENQYKALAILNHDRKQKGLPIWKGTWNEYKRQKLNEFNKALDKTKKRMYESMTLNQEKIFDMGASRAMSSPIPPVISRSEYGKFNAKFLPVEDEDFPKGFDEELWKSIASTSGCKQYAKDVKANLPMPTYKAYWNEVDKKGAKKVNDEIEELVTASVDSIYVYIAKRYMLKTIGFKGKIPDRYLNMTVQDIGKLYKKFIQGGKKGTRRVRTRKPMMRTSKAKGGRGFYIPVPSEATGKKEPGRRASFMPIGQRKKTQKKKRDTGKRGKPASRPMVLFGEDRIFGTAPYMVRGN